MQFKDLVRHTRIDTPVYVLWVRCRPSPRNKGKAAYMDEVANEAKKKIHDPIKSDDVEVEILYSTRSKRNIRADIDNIIKPTLDALNGLAYQDDSQVRSVTATVFQKSKKNLLAGRVEYLLPLLYSKHTDVILLAIYSEERFVELGGEPLVKKRLNDELKEEVKKQSTNHGSV